MPITESCFDANSFPVKNYKNRVLTIFEFKVCSPLGPSKPFTLYTDMVYLHKICKWEAGSRGGGVGHTLILKMVMTLFLKFLTGNKFTLIQVSMVRMCNKIKTKTSLFQQYPLCLGLWQKVAAKTI